MLSTLHFIQLLFHHSERLTNSTEQFLFYEYDLVAAITLLAFKRFHSSMTTEYTPFHTHRYSFCV